MSDNILQEARDEFMVITLKRPFVWNQWVWPLIISNSTRDNGWWRGNSVQIDTTHEFWFAHSQKHGLQCSFNHTKHGPQYSFHPHFCSQMWMNNSIYDDSIKKVYSDLTTNVHGDTDREKSYPPCELVWSKNPFWCGEKAVFATQKLVRHLLY